MIVPVGSISKLTEHALHAALSLGDEVIAVSVHPEAAQSAAFRTEWDRWNAGVQLDSLQNQRGLLLAPVLRARTDVVICTFPYGLSTR